MATKHTILIVDDYSVLTAESSESSLLQLPTFLLQPAMIQSELEFECKGEVRVPGEEVCNLSGLILL